jgi:hypothetical protein
MMMAAKVAAAATKAAKRRAANITGKAAIAEWRTTEATTKG